MIGNFLDVVSWNLGPKPTEDGIDGVFPLGKRAEDEHGKIYGPFNASTVHSMRS